MPATDADGNPLQLNLPPVPSPADVLALAAPDAASQDQSSEQEGGPAKPVRTTPSFPLIYTRPQMLFLQKSPLVKSPPAMPELKQWFGEHEPNPKKDSEPTTPNGTRERRFRRDADDGETSTRPSFRSTLSQPSQMGNFKHQSLRDRDRDGDKDRERDIRDKEGQERLRNLSDKYDRDRLAAPGLRKERDIAPHLAVDSIRGSTSLTAAARRAEARDGSKKKVGEVSEDWRRGSHATRQERNREERPRSRGRDSSRPRRDVSSSRRDRDRDGEDKEPAGDRRDDHRKTTRDDRRTREDHRRERDERRERDRGLDRDAEEDEDSRRWRDDGKRDERMAARRVTDKVSQENGDASGDRRWTVVEDRDGRSKRNHRDRRAGGTADDGKDREDRRDRDREREKEPAWMDTYIPESPGIPVGGKGAEGELDGIQAWKKGLKEKEKTAAVPASKKEEERPAASESVPEKPLDEIQIFRMLMKREEEKKQVDPPPAEPSVASAGPPPGIRAKASQGSHTPESVQAVVSDSTNSGAPPPSAPPGVPPAPVSSSTPAHDTNSLLAILGKAEPLTRPPPLTNPPPAIDADKIPSQAGSRFFPKPISQQNTALNAEKPTISDPSAPSAQFNPPPGSRLLAFGAGRGGKSPGLPPTANGLNGLNHPDSVSQHPVLPNANAGALSPDLPINLGPPKSEPLRSGFSPFEESRMSFGFEEPRDQFGNAESMRRGDRAPHGLPVEAGSYADSVFDPTSTGYSTGKGSRLAKFFDSKVREAPANQNPAGFASTSPNPGGQRFEGGYNPMDGLLSKLNNSAQIPRPNIMSPNSAASVGGAPFGQQAQNNLQILQQQQQQQQHTQAQHLHLNNRLDSLYESRLDDRNFMPDGMVPGLRSVPPPRNRDSVYSDSLEDSIHFNPNPQRLPPQHHRGLDPMYNPIPSGFAQPGARNIPMQPQFRGAPSPISNQQRLPPGLANLGGRPPLDNSQFMGMPGLPSAGLHSGLHPNGPPQQQQQQQFNNFAVNGNLNNYGGGLQPQMRVPPSQLQGNLQHHQLAGLGHPNIDLQRANQAQLLNLGGGGIRGLGMGGGFGPQQGGPPAQMQQPIHALRQQEQQRQQQQLHQQQQLPPHMLHHHMQVGGHPHQQGIGQSNNNGGDLMALLMGGTAHHRD